MLTSRWRKGKLHPCARGATRLTYGQVWETPQNKEFGYIAHPTKSDVKGRRANDPNRIYPGEKIALGHMNFRIQKFRKRYEGWIGEKKFDDGQIDRMNEYVKHRLANPDKWK